MVIFWGADGIPQIHTHTHTHYLLLFFLEFFSFFVCCGNSFPRPSWISTQKNIKIGWRKAAVFSTAAAMCGTLAIFAQIRFERIFVQSQHGCTVLGSSKLSISSLLFVHPSCFTAALLLLYCCFTDFESTIITRPIITSSTWLWLMNELMEELII